MSSATPSPDNRQLTVLCLASYYKGTDFIRECHRQGCRTLLLTSNSIKDEKWPNESIDETFYMPDVQKEWKLEDAILGVSYMAREETIDRIVALDDFDVETAATLREHLRVPGMGDSTARYFRDKLAMRTKARDEGLLVPEFIHVLNYDRLREFMDRVPPPWVLKPRSMAGSMGIKKIHDSEEFWRSLDTLGDRQSFYLLEQYVPGDIFHVDAIFYERDLLFSIASQYGRPPMDVSQEGDIFTTRTLPLGSKEAKPLIDMNQKTMKAFGLVRGVSHSEFIRGRDDGKLYFLETSARVGGAHIVDLIEAATGLNMWAEWAKVEIAGGKAPYKPPSPKKDAAGLLVSLARQERPDTSGYNDPEIVWRMNEKKHHVGLIVKSSDPARVQELLKNYVERMRQEFLAWQPPLERPNF
ncbi:MAG TPA: ATP-grasp domain-containing protein [Verrucomicrobiae bacterium]|jgi:biotin carboxylase|nr:ATP-grasp domain-containing protein [Verrucomicrobiae bacterium]